MPTDAELDREWVPNARRPQSTIAQAFSVELINIFRINDSVSDLDEQIFQKKQRLYSQNTELRALRARLREMEERLGRSPHYKAADRRLATPPTPWQSPAQPFVTLPHRLLTPQQSEHGTKVENEIKPDNNDKIDEDDEEDEESEDDTEDEEVEEEEEMGDEQEDHRAQFHSRQPPSSQRPEGRHISAPLQNAATRGS